MIANHPGLLYIITSDHKFSLIHYGPVGYNTHSPVGHPPRAGGGLTSFCQKDIRRRGLTYITKS